MSEHSYVVLASTHKTQPEDIFRTIIKVESQARACVMDNSRPLPDDAKTVADVAGISKNAKKEQQSMTKLLVLMDRATGGVAA